MAAQNLPLSAGTSWRDRSPAWSTAGTPHLSLEQLYVLYRSPVFAFIRRRVSTPEDAEDLTQAFFVTLIEKQTFDWHPPGAPPARAFLLTALRHFLCNHWDRIRAQKRGGGKPSLPLAPDGESPVPGPADNLTPERIFERKWALLLLERALGTLRRRYEESGYARQFEMLKVCLTGSGRHIRYEEVGAALGLSESAVKMTVHRMRRNWGEALRAEVARTVTDPVEVDDEIRHLLSVLSRAP